jgi:hypothetical protein
MGAAIDRALQERAKIHGLYIRQRGGEDCYLVGGRESGHFIAGPGVEAITRHLDQLDGGEGTKPINKPLSWRDFLTVHPAADLFPRMSESELRELGEDIEKNGLLEQPVFYRDPELGICAARTKGEDVGSVPHVETRTDSRGRKQPATKTKTTKPKPVDHRVTESPEISLEQRRAENAELDLSAEERAAQASASALAEFSVACRAWLPKVTVEADRQAARNLVATLTCSKAV